MKFKGVQKWDIGVYNLWLCHLTIINFDLPSSYGNFFWQVIFKGYSYEGYSQLVESEYLSCLLSSSIAGEIGKFGYKPTVLVDILAGKRASVSTNLGAYTRSFIGDCSPSDFETALQVHFEIYYQKLYFSILS